MHLPIRGIEQVPVRTFYFIHGYINLYFTGFVLFFGGGVEDCSRLYAVE